MNALSEGRNVFDLEIDALSKMRDALDAIFVEILDNIVSCRGKVVLTGMGKPGHIAKKIAASFASLGTPAFCLHPADAMHGDLGMISENDLVIMISYSGESDEIIRIIPNIKIIGAKVVAITGNSTSTLAQMADIVQLLPEFQEACHLGLAPTSSTTAVLCYGDALAVTASKIYGFQKEDFGKFHPAGALGKKLILRVNDLMVKGNDIPIVLVGTYLMDAITEMSTKRLGLVLVTDLNNKLIGIITDGDLRRMIEKKIDIYAVRVEDVMTSVPKVINYQALAIDALKYIKKLSINNLPVIDSEGYIVGAITWQMLVKSGIVI